ncbi:MAG: SDR family NAD(P)-dependent oxidoreductase [Rhabdaerophilum sp.]
MKRSHATRLLIIAHDMAMTALAVVLALFLRFDPDAFSQRLDTLLPILPGFLLMTLGVFFYFRLYQGKWRFASMPDVIMIAKAVGLICLGAIILEFLAMRLGLLSDFVLGRRLVVVYWLVHACLLAAPRLAYRYWKDRYWAPESARDASCVLLLGRGTEVEPIIRALQSDDKARLKPVGILSPRAADDGQAIRGVPVEGTFDLLEDIVRQNAVGGTPIRRVIATPSALQRDGEELATRVKKLGLALVRFEGIGAMGAATGSIEIEDLLSRPPVDIDPYLLERAIHSRVVLVTGGGGSIGLEVCRSCLRLGAKKLIILENSEPAIYMAREALLADGHAPEAISAYLCDIRDRARLDALMAQTKPELVFHAAALKQVPFLEQDWDEGLRTNTLGSLAVADAAIAAGVQIVVMISTDKAVEPVSVLGASKRAAEIAIEALDADQARRGGKTRLISVRFGNVLGSSGSVIPRFKAQIERGGPVTVTDKGMVRYFMTVTEAADLVVVSAAHAMLERGDGRASVYVLRMGQPVRIYDLAERMIRLSGYEPHKDIQIEVTGIRPGERLNEVLFSGHESLKESGIEGVMAARTEATSLAEARLWVEKIAAAVATRDRQAAEKVLAEKIRDFKPNGSEPVTSAPQAPEALTKLAAKASSPVQAKMPARRSAAKTAARSNPRAPSS